MESTTTSLHAVPRDPRTTMATAIVGVVTTVASAAHETVPAQPPMHTDQQGVMGSSIMILDSDVQTMHAVKMQIMMIALAAQLSVTELSPA